MIDLPEWVGDLADVAAFLSLGLTAWVAWKVRDLRKLYQFKGRGPDLLVHLSRRASRISEQLNDFTAFRSEIAAETKRG